MCSPQQPTQTQTAQTELPEWAKPYGKNILAEGAALTDVNQNPYKQYTGDRIAGFSPMQQQAMQDAQGMTAAPQIGQGTAAATMAGLGGLGIASQANPQNFQQNVGGYMNPYMQQVLNPQLDELRRQYGITGTQQAAQATQAGAFGGSRDAIMAAENQRNLGAQQNQAIGQAYGNAFNAAQNQYNQSQNQALQGYGLTGQMAGQLGNLGQLQYGQNMGINQLQNQYGTAQQNLEQQGLNTAYQDFQNQQNYPYKQLGFMSDLLRGTPTGSSSVTNMYQGAPTALQTVGALGMGAYGLNQLTKADGGSVYGYADGGQVQGYADEGLTHDDSVTSQDNTLALINRMTDPHALQLAKVNAIARDDKIAADAIDKRLAMLSESASMSHGLAGVMPPQMADGIAQAAQGGILGYAGDDEDTGQVTDSSQGLGALMSTKGNPVQYAALTNIYPQLLANVAGQQPKYMTDADYDTRTQKELEIYKNAAGPSPYANIGDLISQLGEQGKQNVSQGRGLAALAAMEGMLQPGGAIRGFGRAGKNFAEAYAPILKSDQDLQRSMIGMRINAADAQRKENIGAFTQARTSADAARKSHDAAQAASSKKAMDVANLAARMASTVKPTGSSGAGGSKEPKFNEAALRINIENMLNTEKPNEGESPKAFESRIKAAAVAKTATQIKTDPQLKAAVDAYRTTATSDTEVEKVVKSSKFSDPNWMKAYESGDAAGMAKAEDDIAGRVRSRQTAANPTRPGGGGGGSNIIKIPD
jgi:hypothetical protein